MKRKLLGTAITCSLLVGSLLTNVSYAQENQDPIDVRILSTTDLHTNLVNYDYYQDKPSQKIGLAKTAILIENAKKENANILLVDNGDIIQGTPLGTFEALIQPLKKGEKHPMYAALEILGYDIGTVGNHEFNYGLKFLDNIIKTTKIPIVNANVLNINGTYRFTPYKIITKEFTTESGKKVKLKIGVTGIVPPQIMNWDKANLEGKVHVEDSIKALNTIIPQMKKAGADIIVVLSHSGIGDDKYTEGEENVGYHISKINDVDAVVTGHSHSTFPGEYKDLPNVDASRGLINGKPTVMAGKYGDHLGIIDLKIIRDGNKFKVTDSKGFIRKIDTNSDIADSRILKIAQKAHEGTINYVRTPVGETTSDINSYFSLVKDDPSIQIVNNAQTWYAKNELKGTKYENLPILSAAAPFKAGTRGDASAYTNIEKGGIAVKNVADLYLYDNVTGIAKVNGKQLKEWLEMSAGMFNTINPNSKEPQYIVNPEYRTYNFDVIDGIKYEYDLTKPNKYDKDGNIVNPNSSRVRNLTFEGKEIPDDKEFIVVSNNYRLTSNNFPGVSSAKEKDLLGLENRQVIINYITDQKTINPEVDNNWKFTNNLKELDLRFLSSDEAKNHIKNTNDSDEIVYIGESKEPGFGEFKYIQK